MAVEVVDDRKVRNQQALATLVRAVVVVVAVPPVVLALVAGALARNVLVALLVLVVVAVALAAFAWVRLTGFGAAVVARPGLRPIADTEQPRLQNLVDGLCIANGLARPALVTTSGPGANSAAVTVGWGRSASTALIVSEPLLERLNRIELEGLLAQQLSQFLDGSSALTTAIAALRATAPFGSLLAGPIRSAEEPERHVLADVAAVRMTRYPPGLAAALESLAGTTTDIAAADAATAGLWLADPVVGRAGADDDRPDLAVRAAMLRER